MKVKKAVSGGGPRAPLLSTAAPVHPCCQLRPPCTPAVKCGPRAPLLSNAALNTFHPSRDPSNGRYHRRRRNAPPTSTRISAEMLKCCLVFGPWVAEMRAHITGRNVARGGFILPENIVLAGVRFRRRWHYCRRYYSVLGFCRDEPPSGTPRSTVNMLITRSRHRQASASGHSRPPPDPAPVLELFLAFPSL